MLKKYENTHLFIWLFAIHIRYAGPKLRTKRWYEVKANNTGNGDLIIDHSSTGSSENRININKTLNLYIMVKMFCVKLNFIQFGLILGAT